MSESLSSPWIRDYLMDVAETHGAQLYNTSVLEGKKRVQLTDFLTYQEDSYVWAWISDKDFRVSVRISKDAADAYKSKHQRNIIDCRFFLVFVSSYRPMFSPRPLGPNALGNTPISYISLEINYVSLIGTGAHLFGNPRDLESDENMREWLLGLRQDGGGGNVLKLRKQQKLMQNKGVPSPPHPPSPFSHCAPVAHHQITKVAEDIARPKPERPQDFKRAYAKRWRVIEVDPRKFAAKPVVEERPMQTKLSHAPVGPRLDTASRLEPRSRRPSVCPTSPRRTPSPTPLHRQGTPTNWSPSNRGSPIAPDEANTSAFGNGIRQHDEPEVLPTTPQLPSDTEGYATMGTVITSDTRSLQPPTPAQRIKRSPLPCSPSSLCSSPEPFTRSPLHPSQPLSSPPPPSSSLPLPSSSSPTPVGIRKNFQRKVPHPGLPTPRPDPTKQGPAQILVPNSDTSGAGSSQPYSQSQHLSQSQQQQQPQLLSHSPALPSSLANEFKAPDTSTPREDKPVSTSKMFAEPLPIHNDIDEKETTSADDKADANTGKQESEPNKQPVPSAPRIEVLEVGKSDTEAEIDELQLTHNATRTEVEFDKETRTQDVDQRDTNADHEDSQLSVDKVGLHSALQGSPPRQPSCLAVVSVIQGLTPNKQDIDEVPVHRATQSSEPPGSQSSMHSLFSDSLEDEWTASSSQAPKPTGRTEENVQEKASPPHVPRHDSEAWKEPSFIARNKGKGKARAVEELDTPIVKVVQKRQRSAQPEPPVPKRAKVASPEVRQAAPGGTNPGILGDMRCQDTVTSAIGKTHSKSRPSAATTGTTDTTTRPLALQSSRPRLANFVVDFERIDLGKGVPIPRLNLDPDIKRLLLTTGRIRTCGEVEKDGSVYINV